MLKEQKEKKIVIEKRSFRCFFFFFNLTRPRLITAVQTASKTLMDSINEIYESQWPGHDLLYNQIQNIEMLWQDFSHKLGDQVLIPLNTYQSQFPEMKVSRFVENSLLFLFLFPFPRLSRSPSHFSFPEYLGFVY